MKLTRDSALWTGGFVLSSAVFLAGHQQLLTTAFPGLSTEWQARIELFAAVAAFASGYLKMSPLALSPGNPMAGTSDPAHVVNPLNQPKADQ